MENDVGSTFIQVNIFDNSQLILDEIFSIEVRPAGAFMITRKLSKSFLQKVSHSGLSDSSPQQQPTEYVSKQRDLLQPLHFLPSHCPAMSNELIGNILFRSTAQLTPTQWVDLFMLLSESLGIEVNKLYVRNMLYENIGKKAVVWGQYIGSDSLTGVSNNKTLTMMSFLIGCSKDSAYSDIYRVVIQRVNLLLESIDRDNLLRVLERWFITLEDDDVTETQKLHQRHKRQVAVELPDVQDFYVVLTTAVTDVIASTSIIVPTTVQLPTVSFSSEPILTATSIPVVTMLPSSPLFSAEPFTSVLLPTISAFSSADQTTMDLSIPFITPSPSVVFSPSSLAIIESSSFVFITSPSMITLVSPSLVPTTSVFESPSTSVAVDLTTLPISIPFSSLVVPSSFVTDVIITPSASFTTFGPIATITSSPFTSIETFVVTATLEETSVLLTLPPTDSVPVLSPTSIPSASPIPTETNFNSLLFTDMDTAMPSLLTISPTSASSLTTLPFSSVLVMTTQSDASPSIFTDIIIPTVTMVSVDDMTVIPSVFITATPVLDITLLETILSPTPLVTLSSIESTTIQFTNVPTFSLIDTFTPGITPSISDAFFTTTATIASASSIMLVSPTFNDTMSAMLTPSSDLTDMLTTELPNITLSISDTVLISDITPTLDITEIFTIITVSPTVTSQIPPLISTTVFPPDSVSVNTQSIMVTDAFTTLPSFDITSVITIPSIVTSDVVSIDDTVFTLPLTVVTTTNVLTDVISPTSVVPFTDTFSFTMPSVTSIITNITSSVSSFDFTSIVTPSPVLNTSGVPTPSLVGTSEDIFTTMLPDVSTTIVIPMTIISVPEISSPPTILPSLSTSMILTSNLTSEVPSPSFTVMDTDSFTISSIVMDSSISTKIISPSTMLPSVIPTPSTILTGSEISSPTITLMDTDSFTIIMNSSVPTEIISPSMTVITTPTFISTSSEILSLMNTNSFTISFIVVESSIPTDIISPFTMLPSVIPTPIISSEIPSPTVISINTESFTISSIAVESSIPIEIISPSIMPSSVIPTPRIILTTSELPSPTITLMDTDSFTISSIVMDSSVPLEIISPSIMLPSVIPTPSITLISSEIPSPTITLMDTDSFTTTVDSSVPTEILLSTMLPSVIPTPSIILTSIEILPTITLMDTATPNVTIPSVIPTLLPTSIAIVTPTPSIISSLTTNTSDLASPSPILNETSSVSPSVITLSMTLPSTTILMSSQVLNVSSVIDFPTTTIATGITSVFTTITETSVFVPTTTLIFSTTITPSPTTIVTTPTPTVTNQAPQLVNPIRPLTWQEGQPAMYKIPEDTFYDDEDGATSNLSLTLLSLPGQLVSNTSWIQIVNSILYGLPLNEQIQNSSVTEYVFILTAQDSQSVEAYDFLVIVVEPQDPFIANLITFFVEGDFNLFNQQIVEKTRLVNQLMSFGSTNVTDDVYIRDLFNGSIGIKYGNRSVGNSDCAEFVVLVQSIFNNETVMYSNTFATALLPFNVTKLVVAEGPCYEALFTPVTTPTDFGITATEERSSTVFLATVIPGVAVVLILLVVTLLGCILYRRSRPGHEMITFVRRNTIAFDAEVPNRQRKHNPVIIIDIVQKRINLTGPSQHQPDERDPPPYQQPIAYEDYKNLTQCTT